MTTGEIIKKIMEDRGMTMEELAKATGIHKQTLCKVCEDKTNLQQLKLIKIANALDVKLEDLYPAGSPEHEAFSNTDIRSKIERLRIERGMSQEKLALDADISTPTLSKVYKGEYKSKTIIKLANALGVNVQELDPSITA